MENLLKVLADIESAELKLNGEKINQVQRNGFKASLMSALVSDLEALGVNATLTKDGVVVMVENQSSNIYLNLDGTIKNLDFDLDGAKQEYAESIEAKATRETEAKLRKEKALSQKANKKQKGE